jgi:hypothetical protein
MTNLDTAISMASISVTEGVPKKRQPKVLLFGDSHAHAVLRAITKREGKGQPVPVSAHRLLKEKNGVRIGTTSFETFLSLIANLGKKDIVVSMIGGNQHAVYSTIQHPRRFDFFSPDVPLTEEADVEIVPYRALEETFEFGLRKGDGATLAALRAGTKARIVHVLPPPPKRDNEHIVKNHETLFRKDLPERGVSSPELRRKFWQLQARVLQKICGEMGIEIAMPPHRAVDEAGFLRPEFYAKDATHGNWLYGERVLRAVERRYLKLAERQEEE